MLSFVTALLAKLALLRLVLKGISSLGLLLPLALLLKVVGLPALIVLAIVAIPIIVVLALIGLPFILVFALGAVLVSIVGSVLAFGARRSRSSSRSCSSSSCCGGCSAGRRTRPARRRSRTSPAPKGSRRQREARAEPRLGRYARTERMSPGPDRNDAIGAFVVCGDDGLALDHRVPRA